jgi:predicted nucleic acid-binding protein
VTTKPIDKIAWDAMVAIDCLQKTPEQLPFIVPMIREAEEGKLLLVCSTILKTETFKVKGSTAESAKQIETIRAFFQNEYFQFEAVHDWIAEFAQDLRREHGLTATDAIHVATAVYTRTPILLTRDGETTKRKKLLPLDGRIRHRDPGGPVLRIMTPRAYHEMRMRAENPLMNQPEQP